MGQQRIPFGEVLPLLQTRMRRTSKQGSALHFLEPGSKLPCADHLKLAISDQASINDSGNPTGFLTSG